MRWRLLIALAVLLAPQAVAGGIEAVRVGATVHNVCILDCDNADKEDGPNLNAQVSFAPFANSEVIGSPRPYVMASGNLSGNTSVISAGLEWVLHLDQNWTLEPSIGIALHDGVLESAFPQGDPRGDAFTQKHVLFGSRDLIRTSLALGRNFNGPWGAELMVEHYSHGQFLGEGRNQGINMAGVRVRYRLPGALRAER